MKREDYLRNEITAIRHCATREICPFSTICGVDSDQDTQVIAPVLVEVPKDGLIWVNLRNEHRVIAIKSGLFATITTDTEEEEVFSIYGPGYCGGLAELYIDRDVCSTYYLKALTDGEVCSFPANAFRHRLESLSTTESNRIMSCALTNWCAASFELLKLYSYGKKNVRLALFLKYLQEQSDRCGGPVSTFRLSHDELAYLIRSDRASVTRALHSLEHEGLVSLGYKTICLCENFGERVAAYGDLKLTYHEQVDDSSQ